MVKTTEPRVIRIVLDTNVLVSALLFGGKLNRLVVTWKSGDVVPVMTFFFPVPLPQGWMLL